MKRLIIIVAVGIVLALLFRRFCFETVYVASPSMEPTFKTKDRLIVNKTAYILGKPKRGDIVLLRSPVSGKGLIKRVIAVPGEYIEIVNKDVFINDEFIREEYVQYTRPSTVLVGDNLGPILVNEDNYFVMGDNRDVSRDSRDWSEEEGLQTATVVIRNIEGKIIELF
ncbi:signal peptidase I [Elusimicrobiota bacterium]